MWTVYLSLSRQSFTTRRERVHNVIIIFDIRMQHQIIKTYVEKWKSMLILSENLCSVLTRCGLLRGPFVLKFPVIKGLNTFICISRQPLRRVQYPAKYRRPVCTDVAFLWLNPFSQKKNRFLARKWFSWESRDMICLYFSSKPYLSLILGNDTTYDLT